MDDYINLKIDNNRYVQRHKFSKILIFTDDGIKYTIDNIEELPKNVQKIINTSFEMKNYPDEYFKFKETDDGIIITEYIGKDTDVVIPNYINAKPIIELDAIFAENTNVKNIIMPDSVEKINSNFCNKASKLENIYLSKNINTIPFFAFANCKKLSHINLENIKIISNYAFHNCANLKNIDVRNVEKIKPFAFLLCVNLTSIIAPKLYMIEKSAFTDCRKLTSIEFSDKLAAINSSVFNGCHSLEKITLPDNIKKIQKYAFKYCKSLKTINFPKKLEEIQLEAFSMSGLSGELTLPPKLKKIDDFAFFQCELTKINISNKTEYTSTSFSLDDLSKIKTCDNTYIAKEREER